jgi:hypothetical protein
MVETIEKRLLSTREKIRQTRREITGGVVEDKIKELGKRSYDELDNELDALHKAVVEGKAKAKDVSGKIFEELEQDISAARMKLQEKRMDITGGAGEEKAKEAAHIIKEKGEQALKEIEEDIGKISEKIKSI